MITRTVIGGREWLKVISAPRLKVLRIHLFGLTLGFAALLTHLIFAPWSEIRFFLLLAWFAIGYLFGFIFGQLYNYFVFIYLQILHPEWMKLWFYYDPNQEVNVIKTPTPNDDWDLVTQQLYQNAPFKVFDQKPYPGMTNPYTIVFVANPLLRTTDPDIIPDPIMNNINLFLRAVERALFSFEFNHEVIGHPDIWSKIRIVTINPVVRMRRGELSTANSEAALVEETEGNFTQFGASGDFSTFILQPSTATNVRAAQFVRQALQNQGFGHINHIDVIFSISASETHDRSSAEPAQFSAAEIMSQTHRQGATFTFSTDPYCQKQGEILKNACEESLCTGATTGDCVHSTPSPGGEGGPDRVLTHEFFSPCEGVGRVALSALDVRDRLPIHEFGHAMSSVYNGQIVDEYYDYALIADQPGFDPFAPEPYIVINRIYREPARMSASHEIRVHNIFARYNGYVYESDRQHPSAQQGWYGYFPERRQREVNCTMDADKDVYEFDELLRDFMYDRLWVKVNRHFLTPSSSSPPEPCPPTDMTSDGEASRSSLRQPGSSEARVAKGVHIIILSYSALLSAILSIGGLYLAFIKRVADTNFNLFGNEFSSTNVGVAMVFIGTLLFVLIARPVLNSLHIILKLPGKKRRSQYRRKRRSQLSNR